MSTTTLAACITPYHLQSLSANAQNTH